MLDVVTLGEAMVLLVPTQVGQLRYAHQFERFVAGASSNTAIGLARVGHSVGWVSSVGNDEFGQCILTFLRGEQVDVSQVLENQNAPTGMFIKERRRRGVTRVFYYRSGSAASQLLPTDINAAYLQQAKYLHLTGIMPALNETCKETTFRAIQIAQEAGVNVSFDPNLRLKLWSAAEAKKTYLEIIPQVQIVLTSEDEATLITGLDKPELAARAILAMGPQLVVIKLGAEGAIGFSNSEIVKAEPLSVDVVETVGAGDAFNAGFLSGQLRGWSLSESLRLGNVMGALATTTPGDVEGLPTWPEIQPFLGGADIIER